MKISRSIFLFNEAITVPLAMQVIIGVTIGFEKVMLVMGISNNSSSFWKEIVKEVS